MALEYARLEEEEEGEEEFMEVDLDDFCLDVVRQSNIALIIKKKHILSFIYSCFRRLSSREYCCPSLIFEPDIRPGMRLWVNYWW